MPWTVEEAARSSERSPTAQRGLPQRVRSLPYRAPLRLAPSSERRVTAGRPVPKRANQEPATRESGEYRRCRCRMRDVLHGCRVSHCLIHGHAELCHVSRSAQRRSPVRRTGRGRRWRATGTPAPLGHGDLAARDPGEQGADVRLRDLIARVGIPGSPLCKSMYLGTEWTGAIFRGPPGCRGSTRPAAWSRQHLPCRRSRAMASSFRGIDVPARRVSRQTARALRERQPGVRG